MKNYEYPRVHPPSSLLPPQQPPDTRFSWMHTSAEEEHRVWANNMSRVANTPSPLQASDRLEGVQEQPQAEAQTRTQTMPLQHYGVGPDPYQAQNHEQVAQHQFPPHHQHTGAYGQPTMSQVQEEHQRYATPPPPQPVEPSKHPALPETEPTAPIVPDSNPLTPTTPKRANRMSTNMAIVPPSTDPSQFPPGSFTPSPQSIRGGSWQHGFCSCADPTICLTGLFCPCIVYGKTQYRLTQRAEKKDPTNLLGYTAVNGSCVAFAVLCGINGILAAIQHTRVRKAFAMSSDAGNVAGDCIKGVCCCCCVVAQDEKEVKFREEQARKPSASATRMEGYVAPITMTFNPPPR